MFCFLHLTIFYMYIKNKIEIHVCATYYIVHSLRKVHVIKIYKAIIGTQ